MCSRAAAVPCWVGGPARPCHAARSRGPHFFENTVSMAAWLITTAGGREAGAELGSVTQKRQARQDTCLHQAGPPAPAPHCLTYKAAQAGGRIEERVGGHPGLSFVGDGQQPAGGAHKGASSTRGRPRRFRRCSPSPSTTCGLQPQTGACSNHTRPHQTTTSSQLDSMEILRSSQICAAVWV